MNLKRIIREKIEDEFKWIDDTPSSVRGEDLIGYYVDSGDEEDLNESEMGWMEDTQPTFLEKLKVATETNPNINVIFDEYITDTRITHREESHLWEAPRVSITDKRGRTYFTNEELYWYISKEDFLAKVMDSLGGFNETGSYDEEDYKELYKAADSLIIEGKENELKWLQNTGTSLKLTVDDLENYYGENFTMAAGIYSMVIYYLEQFYEDDEFEWVKDGTRVRWYDPIEEFRDLERIWIIKDYDRYLEDTQPFSKTELVYIDDLPINIESEEGHSEAEVFLREIEPIQPIEGVVVDNNRVNVCWKETSIHHICNSYLKTDVVSYFNNSDWVFLSMTKMNESNEFDWIENIEPTTIHTRNEKFQSYLDNEFEVTHIINHLAHNMDMFSELGEYLRNVAPDDWDPMGVRMLSMDDNIAGNRFLGMAFFTTFLSGDILEKVFGIPINHSEFGEGFEGGPEGFESDKGYRYSSYIIEINGHLYHVGYDHRGTVFEPDVTTSYDDVMKDAKSLIDYIFEKI